VIDDDPLVLDSMRCTLQDLGCHVMAAGSVLEALERVGGEARVPDIIISDYRLRDRETGIDAIRILRENLHGEEAPALPIPGLIISGDTSPEELNAVSQEGLIMLHKPVAPHMLRAKMNELLGAYAQALCVAVDREP
jgi:CheY-like chemotaxis protein